MATVSKPSISAPEIFEVEQHYNCQNPRFNEGILTYVNESKHVIKRLQHGYCCNARHIGP